jgi:hypothetical protein
MTTGRSAIEIRLVRAASPALVARSFAWPLLAPSIRVPRTRWAHGAPRLRLLSVPEAVTARMRQTSPRDPRAGLRCYAHRRTAARAPVSRPCSSWAPGHACSEGGWPGSSATSRHLHAALIRRSRDKDPGSRTRSEVGTQAPRMATRTRPDPGHRTRTGADQSRHTAAGRVATLAMTDAVDAHFECSLKPRHASHCGGSACCEG